MKILVFTNRISLKNVNVDTVLEKNSKNNNALGHLLDAYNFVFREGATWKGYNEISSKIPCDFILIKDTIDYASFDSLRKIFKSNDEYRVIHHTKPDDKEFYNLKRQFNWIIGVHTANNSIYQPIADAITNAETKNDKEIVKEIADKIFTYDSELETLLKSLAITDLCEDNRETQQKVNDLNDYLTNK